jgi:hypothetical protein
VRVLTTGWREWHKSPLNVQRLHIFMDSLLDMVLLTDATEMQLIHGGAPGADTEIQTWWALNRPHHFDFLPTPQQFLANWSKYGSAAGPLRNQAMVTAGADLCVAFVHPTSRGTVDCRDKARRAGIFTLQVDWVDDRVQPPVLLPKGSIGVTAPPQAA